MFAKHDNMAYWNDTGNDQYNRDSLSFTLAGGSNPNSIADVSGKLSATSTDTLTLSVDGCPDDL
ncbi:hypothetical protein FRB95_009066 [Tulasnella sp. JGI-2019a]|nr:hypothetical protein FRB95_009066 [Tulasnella sp. JGI-2019a]